jgi:hypothetical protein
MAACRSKMKKKKRRKSGSQEDTQKEKTEKIERYECRA